MDVPQLGTTLSQGDARSCLRVAFRMLQRGAEGQVAQAQSRRGVGQGSD